MNRNNRQPTTAGTGPDIAQLITVSSTRTTHPGTAIDTGDPVVFEVISLLPARRNILPDENSRMNHSFPSFACAFVPGPAIPLRAKDAPVFSSQTPALFTSVPFLSIRIVRKKPDEEMVPEENGSRINRIQKKTAEKTGERISDNTITNPNDSTHSNITALIKRDERKRP